MAALNLGRMVLNMRRLAAIDMWGTAGTIRRRRIIAAEFVVGLLLGALIGGFLIFRHGSVFGVVLGVAVLGIGLNYGPLSAHALSLLPDGRLEAELADVDKGAELRRYAALQFYIVIPFLGLMLGIAQARQRR